VSDIRLVWITVAFALTPVFTQVSCHWLEITEFTSLEVDVFVLYLSMNTPYQLIQVRVTRYLGKLKNLYTLGTPSSAQPQPSFSVVYMRIPSQLGSVSMFRGYSVARSASTEAAVNQALGSRLSMPDDSAVTRLFR
jgi:hypothetical protein